MSELIVREITENEVGQVAQLAANVLSNNNREQSRIVYDTYANKMVNRPADSILSPYRAVFYKNKLVSFVHIIDFQLRYGRAVLKVMGISLVCTHPSYRHRGYASAIIKDTLTFAAEQGAHLVLLHSHIATFFQRFGFSPVWPHYTLQFSSQLAANMKQPLQLRVATPSDLPIMARLYNNSWGMRVTIERPFELWRWRMNHSRGEAAVMVNQVGQIKGYLWHFPDDYSDRIEVIASVPSAIATALAYCGRRWQSAGHETVAWSVPPDDVIVPHIQQMLPITLSASYFPSSGWMARMIDSGAMIDELLPEIVAQAQATSPEFDVDKLILKIEPDGVDIGLRHIPASDCHLSLRDFIQLLFGSLRPEALAVREPLSRDSLRLLDMLFPARIAALAAWDWF